MGPGEIRITKDTKIWQFYHYLKPETARSVQTWIFSFETHFPQLYHKFSFEVFQSNTVQIIVVDLKWVVNFMEITPTVATHSR